MAPSKEIREHLSQEPILRTLIAEYDLKDRTAQPSVYEALLRSINYQQLSGASASAIHGRFLDLFPQRFPDPEMWLELSEDTIRRAGLSRQKALYVQNTARFFLENDLMASDWHNRPDETIIDLLTQIKGVGRWTVEMILMFTLKRPDVLPLDDLVVRKAWYNYTGWKTIRERAFVKNFWRSRIPGGLTAPWRAGISGNGRGRKYDVYHRGFLPVAIFSFFGTMPTAKKVATASTAIP